jgi:hypothetical protein
MIQRTGFWPVVIFVALFYDLELESVKVKVTDGIESCVQEYQRPFEEGVGRVGYVNSLKANKGWYRQGLCELYVE